MKRASYIAVSWRRAFKRRHESELSFLYRDSYEQVDLRVCIAPTRKEKEFMATVEERVKQIIVEQLGVDEAEVTPKASFVDDLGADSLDTVELVMAFEEAFDV